MGYPLVHNELLGVVAVLLELLDLLPIAKYFLLMHAWHYNRWVHVPAVQYQEYRDITMVAMKMTRE